MKKVKRLFAVLFSLALVLNVIQVAPVTQAKADDSYTLYVGFGGDAAESGDWGYQYNSPNSADNSGEVTAVNETIAVGETKTVSVTVPTAALYTWWIAPVLVAEGVTDLDATVSLKVDGADVTIDTAAGDAWWYEGTGEYSAEQSIRLAGGYNEWGAHYIESPAFTTVEYTVTLNSISFGETAGYPLYVGFGGDLAESGDWGYQYNSPNSSDNSGEVTAVNGTIAVGETKTVSVTVPTAALYTWWIAPVLVAEGVTDLDATVSLKVDGADVAIDTAAGDAWWYEGTGEYSAEQSIRLAGGYNEWGAHYIESPAFTTVEYTVTLNSITLAGEQEGEAANTIPDTDSHVLYVGFGGDLAESGDWGYQYNSPNSSDNSGEVTAVNETIAVGETKTVSVTVPAPVLYTWWIAPVLVADDIVELDATVSLKVDGEDVAIDTTAGDAWWYEGTGEYSAEQSIRLAGGYNEWGAHYIESPAFTTLEYTVTLNALAKADPNAAPTEEETAAPSVTADLDGTYNAYLGFQTPTYSFRNAFDDATYGRDTEHFDKICGWDSDNNLIYRDGTLTDAEIKGNGTYTVSVEGLDLSGDFDSQETFNLLFLSTDIPNSGEIVISDIVLKVNGSEVDDVYPIVSPDSPDYLNMMIVNQWNNSLDPIGYYSVPPTKISITFTVSGMNYDKPADPTPTPAPTTETKPTSAPESTEDGNDSSDSAPVVTQAASGSTEDGGSNVGLIVGIVIAVVVVAAVVVVVVMKKKKD